MTKQDKVDLLINGERVSGCAPSSLIVDILRNDLGLLGTKKGCESGACGACTILLDGLPVLSCKLFAGSASEHCLMTIEGLAQDPDDQRLIDSFALSDFPGCGDCISGFIMAAKALLQVDPAPEVTEIKRALAGNLCRCVSHEFFIDAVLKASGQAKPDPISQQIDPQFPFGQATSIRDIRLPQQAEVVVLGSRFAGAKVVHINTQRAQLAPGVVTVLTAEGQYEDDSQTSWPTGNALRLATAPSYVGEPIAIVVADTHEQAARALSLIEVEYEIASGGQRNTDTADAYEDNCTQPQDPPHSVSCRTTRARTTRALAGSGGAIASWNEDHPLLLTDVPPTDDDRLALFDVVAPGPVRARTDWAGIAPTSAARCVISRNDVVLAALLSRALGRPVRVHPHAGSFGFRPAQELSATAFTFDDGELERLELEIDIDTGVDQARFSQPSMRASCGARPHRVHMVVRGTTSNTPPSALIDHNSREVAFCIQQSLDAAARHHDLDPLSFRLRQIDNAVVADGLTTAAEAFGWNLKWRGWTHECNERRRPGVGLALTGEETLESGGCAVAIFMDVHVDTDIGTVSLGDCTVLAIACSAPLSLFRLAAQTGLAQGMETALVREAIPVDDLNEAPVTGHYLSRSMSTLDIPRVAYLLKESGTEAKFSFESVSSSVAAATVGAIANAVRDATGIPPTTLPIAVDRLRWRDTSQAATGQCL